MVLTMEAPSKYSFVSSNAQHDESHLFFCLISSLFVMMMMIGPLITYSTLILKLPWLKHVLSTPLAIYRSLSSQTPELLQPVSGLTDSENLALWFCRNSPASSVSWAAILWIQSVNRRQSPIFMLPYSAEPCEYKQTEELAVWLWYTPRTLLLPFSHLPNLASNSSLLRQTVNLSLLLRTCLYINFSDCLTLISFIIFITKAGALLNK